MSLSNDSIEVTPGTGAAVATHLAGGKEHQVVVLAGDRGHLHGTKPSYMLWVPPQAAAAGKIYFDLFNATGSGKIIEINGAWAIPKTDVAVTGAVSIELLVQRTSTVGTAGTAAAYPNASATSCGINPKDTGNAAPPAQISARLVPTGGATAAAHLFTAFVFSEESNAGTLMAQFFNLFPDANTEYQTLTLNEGQGLAVRQGAVASVNSYGFLVDFSVL